MFRFPREGGFSERRCVSQHLPAQVSLCILLNLFSLFLRTFHAIGNFPARGGEEPPWALPALHSALGQTTCLGCKKSQGSIFATQGRGGGVRLQLQGQKPGLAWSIISPPLPPSSFSKEAPQPPGYLHTTPKISPSPPP